MLHPETLAGQTCREHSRGRSSVSLGGLSAGSLVRVRARRPRRAMQPLLYAVHHSPSGSHTARLLHCRLRSDCSLESGAHLAVMLDCFGVCTQASGGMNVCSAPSSSSACMPLMSFCFFCMLVKLVKLSAKLESSPAWGCP